MKHFNITVNGAPYNVTVEETATGSAGAAPVATAPVAAPVAAAPVAPVAPAGAQGAVVVSSPMPGNIIDVRVTVGASVKAGDILVILEAMKMENEIVSPQDGVIASIGCAKGDVVNVGATLITLN